MKKILKFLSLLLPLLVALGSIFAVQIAAVLIYYSVYFTAGFYLLLTGKDNMTIDILVNYMPIPSMDFLTNLGMLSPMVWIIIFFLWYKSIRKKETVVRVKVFNWRSILMLLLVSIGFQLLINGLMELILPFFEELAQDYNEIMEQLNYANPLLTLLSVVILAPLSEELIFRGVILSKATRFTTFAVANVLQALFFGFFHMNIVQGLYAFLGGLAMGYIAHQYRTIKASILFHFFFNGISYVMLAPISLLMKIVYVIGGAIIIFFALKHIKRTVEEQITRVQMPEDHSVEISD
ncbi:MAG: CPBP family intramembrane metalloprotease [Mobilitalea sp.]